MLSLCVSPLTCLASTAEDHQYILYLLENGQYDMAIHVIEGLKQFAASQGQQQVPVPQSPVNELVFDTVPETTGQDWIFRMDIINQTSETLTLEMLQIVDIFDDQPLHSFELAGPELERLGLAGLTLAPNSGQGWNDGHPVTPDFNRRDYIFHFVTEHGEPFNMVFAFDMRGSLAPVQQEPEARWEFPILLENTGSIVITLVRLDITDLMNGEPVSSVTFGSKEDLERIRLGDVILAPGEHRTWGDGHPVVDYFNGREYRFFFEDERGTVTEQVFLFDELDKQTEQPDYAQDEGQDLKTLRHSAAFEVEVAPGVFWVPAVSLGASRYANRDIHAMLTLSPQEKQAQITTLYEALQLYQVGGFMPSDDNIRIFENGVNWEHHKPGYHAVRTNNGCCATDSNWLHYILDGDYEEVGFLATSQRDGSGHVYNYILHNGWYYFVDLTHYHASGGTMDNAVESGRTSDYYLTDYILGNIHKVADVQDYVNYVQSDFGDPPGLMFMYKASDVLAVDGAPTQNGVAIIYEEAGGLPIHVIFDDPSDQLTFERRPSPQQLPGWN